MRTLLSALLLSTLPATANAQDIDSIHVYARVPAGTYTSASANALAWQLHREHAPHRVVQGSELGIVGDALRTYRPERHTFGPLPELAHLAMAFTSGRPMAFGVTDDLDRVINFTARTEYRISGLEEHLRVRALLARLLVE